MFSTELIRKFPQNPTKKILYVVYAEDHIEDATFYVIAIHGFDYRDEFVKIVPINTKVEDLSTYDAYIDPMVYKYMHSWNN